MNMDCITFFAQEKEKCKHVNLRKFGTSGRMGGKDRMKHEKRCSETWKENQKRLCHEKRKKRSHWKMPVISQQGWLPLTGLREDYWWTLYDLLGKKGGLFKIQVDFSRFSVFLNHMVRLKAGEAGSWTEGMWVVQRGRIFVHPLQLPSNKW